MGTHPIFESDFDCLTDDIERTKMSVIDDVKVIETIGATVLRNIFQKIYLYTSASAFSEILQRLKQNSKTSCDLGKLPTEVGVKILKCLDATDLALASCVWHELGSDWSVWMDLCKRTWRGPARLYSRKPKSWKSLYMLLDEATVQFNADPKWGIALLAQHNLIDPDSPRDIGYFIHGTEKLHWKQVRSFLSKRYDILEEVTKLQSFKNVFLPSALRTFFAQFHIPKLSQASKLEQSIQIFSRKYESDNPTLSLDSISITAYAIVLLSVDLSADNNQIRNKMSKREFIKNTTRALQNEECDLLRRECGDYYDNVYLCGHIAPDKWD